MNDDPERVRRTFLRRAEAWLRLRGTPRFHMLLIVSATGAFGFLFSFLMLKAGVASMVLRYPLAVGLAYLVFLGLLRLWLGYQRTRPSPGDIDDGGNLADSVLNSPDVGTGDLGGGGSGHGSAGDALGALDFDEWLFVVIAVAAICAGLLACLYVVWTAPTLLAEVLVDGIVMSSVYRKLKVVGQAYWVSGALRRTWKPALFVAVCLAVAGFAMHKIAPEAKSIGPVITHVVGKAS